MTDCKRGKVGSTDLSSTGDSRPQRQAGAVTPKSWYCDVCLIRVDVDACCTECGIDAKASFWREVKREKMLDFREGFEEWDR